MADINNLLAQKLAEFANNGVDMNDFAKIGK